MAARFISTGLFLLLVAATSTALGQTTGPAIAGLSDDPLYVEPGAADVDESRLRSAIETANNFGADLRIAVLAAGNDAESLAATIAAGLGSSTVLVFTPTSYGVFSDELSQGRLDDALSSAADALGGPDTAAGAAAFAGALDPDRGSGGISAGVVAAGIVGLLVVVGVGGRVWDVKTRDARHARRRNRRRSELTDRTRRIADQVLELSDPVELAARPELSAGYAAATARFDDAELAIAGAATMHDLDEVEKSLAEAEQLLENVRAGLRSAG